MYEHERTRGALKYGRGDRAEGKAAEAAPAVGRHDDGRGVALLGRVQDRGHGVLDHDLAARFDPGSPELLREHLDVGVRIRDDLIEHRESRSHPAGRRWRPTYRVEHDHRSGQLAGQLARAAERGLGKRRAVDGSQHRLAAQARRCTGKRRHEQHGHGARAQHGVGDRAVQEASETAPAVGRHDDQRCTPGPGLTDDALGRIADASLCQDRRDGAGGSRRGTQPRGDFAKVALRGFDGRGQRLAARGLVTGDHPNQEATYLLGRCLPYQQGSSYAIVSGILRDFFRIGDDDDASLIADKMEARSAALDAVQVLLPLLTSGRVKGALDRLTPEQWQQTAYAVVRELIEREASTNPMIIFFEDLHWIDPSSRDLLTYLIQNLRGRAVQFFLIYRPDLEEPPAWTNHPGWHREAIQPLTPAQSESLIFAILPGIELPPGVLGQVVGRAAGNPFYVEEILKSFAESGAIFREGDAWHASQDTDQFQVPESVQGILRTRIDRLGDQPRRVLQQAAVIGRRLRRSLLSEVSEVKPVDPHLVTLTKQEFIYASSEEPDTYSFRNVLAQEVAYSVLLVRRRRVYHRRVADAYERLYATQLESHADDLAYHYFHAEVWPKALAFGRLAADRAKALYANVEAIQHYKRCLAAIERLEEVLSSEWQEGRQPDLTDLNRDRLAAQRLEIVMNLGDVEALVGSYDDALATYTSGLELAQEPQQRADVLCRMADSIHEKRARWQDALDCLARAAEEMAAGEPDLRLGAKIEIALSRVYWRLQRLDDARAIAERCITQLEGTAIRPS